MANDFSKRELEELQAEFEVLDAEFEGFGLSEAELASDDFDLLNELEAEAQEAGLLDADFEAMSLSTMADDAADVAFFGGWIKRKVKKLIRKLLRLIRKYGSRCKSAIPLVAAAVAKFKAGKWLSALRAAYKAYRAIKRCIG